jgi:hypothetical protein
MSETNKKYTHTIFYQISSLFVGFIWVKTVWGWFMFGGNPPHSLLDQLNTINYIVFGGMLFVFTIIAFFEIFLISSTKIKKNLIFLLLSYFISLNIFPLIITMSYYYQMHKAI